MGIGDAYFVDANDERDNLSVLRAILRAFGRDEDDFDWAPDRPGHDLRYAIDASKLQRELGWKPTYTDFDAGLSATIDWCRQHESWWREA